jgi:hypothetical protein
MSDDRGEVADLPTSGKRRDWPNSDLPKYLGTGACQKNPVRIDGAVVGQVCGEVVVIRLL